MCGILGIVGREVPPPVVERMATSPLYPWDWLPAHPKVAMMIIKSLQQTAAAILVFRSSRFHSAAVAAERLAVRRQHSA